METVPTYKFDEDGSLCEEDYTLIPEAMSNKQLAEYYKALSEYSPKKKEEKMDFQTFIEKEKKLDDLSKKLKSKFIGIDEIIDKIILSIRAWYITPGLLTRPCVVCLFGSTGVGKTDLVRTIADELDLYDKYIEILLNEKSNSKYDYGDRTSSIGEMISRYSNIRSGDHSIMLIDELQNFRTIHKTPSGTEEVEDVPFMDLWTLLSDGKLFLDNKHQEAFEEYVKYKNLEQTLGKEDDPEKKKELASKIENVCSNFYSNQILAGIGSLNYTVEDWAGFDLSKRIEILSKHFVSKEIFRPRDFSKTLIFIAGNIDDAYSGLVSPEMYDISADSLHERSKKITIFDIKHALSKRFKPEQIARLGNNYIIYPLFSCNNYKDLISSKLKAISLSVKEKCGVDIYFDESINDVIYKNGVFPSQGVRPVLSTIGGVVENNIPQVIIGSRFQANNIIMSYRDGKIEAYSNDMLIWSQEYHGHINQLLIDQRKKIDINCLVAVHESGHAIANALLMGTVFDDLISVSANDEGGVGAYLNSLDVFSKDEYRNMITISMCGRVAEKKVFNVITSGASQDIEDATELANKMIREYGMDKFYSYINSSNGYANNDVESTNSLIENIIASHYEQAENLINANYGLLLKLSDVLIKKEKMTGDELIEFFKDNGIDVMKTKDAKSKIRYREIFDRELGNFIGSE